jgi:hypothetical protein
MRTRVQGRINVDDVIRQIECEIKSYSRAVNIVMELNGMNYKEAKAHLNRNITNRLIFKN